MHTFIWLNILNLIVMDAFSQRTITFPSLDKLPITADLYESKDTYPFILLFHQAGYSRGEFKETAVKFAKFGYNCLAVDLRSGNEINFVKNKTAEAASEKNLPTNYLDAVQDMQSAVDYVSKISEKPIVVLGSSYSASLCLMIALKNKNIKAVIAFSPGEYFEKKNLVADTVKELSIPVFAASSVSEYPYMTELFLKMNKNNLTLFKPSKGKGVHGAKALWENNDASNEYWLALMLFFSQIKD
jgi:dienelactone hydrolase